MLRRQLEYHWREYLFVGLLIAVQAALTFGALALADYGQHALTTSVRKSTPSADFLVYADHKPAADIAADIAASPDVVNVHVDAWLAAEALSPGGKAPVTLRKLAPLPFQTQSLTSGAYPSSDDQIALSKDVARRLGADVDSTITVASGKVAKRYVVSGIYARSPFETGINPGGEGLVVEPSADYVAAPRDHLGYGGIEVRATSAASADKVLTDLLKSGTGTVIRGDDRAQIVRERHAHALDSLLTPMRWLVLSGAAITALLLFIGFVALHQRRITQLRYMRSLGVARTRQARMALGELGTVTALSASTGLVFGIVACYAVVAIVRVTGWAMFMPAHLRVSLGTYALTLGIVVASVAGAALLAAVFVRPHHNTELSSDAPRRRSRALLPLLIIAGAYAIYRAAIPSYEPAPALPIQARSIGIIALLIAAVFALVITLVALIMRRLGLGARTHLFPRTRGGLIRALALVVILVGTSTFTAILTVTYSIASQGVTVPPLSRPGTAAFIVQAAVCVVLGFVVLGHAPRAFRLYDAHSRYLLALGTTRRQRALRRLLSATVSAATMIVAGCFAGVASAWTILWQLPGTQGQLHVPLLHITAVATTSLIICVTYGATVTVAGVVKATNGANSTILRH
ncbi:ABC transporter permease family protein [Trueperella bialowiezensis]|uniref:FtsX-like permease family n=1 Tax=Trueperella bialowiezensis TaxID=312285 RepID=A0A448PFW2_9ACTO|nr:hypothetical protein [Trueperella bialowiezensis]VEI13822.1 Uncharacterised protein [Trueperella bialowiezensis]